MAHLRSLFIALVSFIPAVVSADSLPGPASTSRSTEFSPVRISYGDLFAVIERARDLIRLANQGVDRTYEDESLRLSGGGLSITLPPGFSEASLTGAPEMATDVYYYYRLRDAPVAEVELRLGDSWRTITVSGTAHSQVDALIGLIQADLSQYGVRLAGAWFRTFCGGTLFVWAILCVAWSFSSAQMTVKIASLFAAFVLEMTVFFLPWAAWLPGTALFQGEASFLVRHTAVISFVSLLLGAVALPLAVASALRKPTSQIQLGKPAA